MKKLILGLCLLSATAFAQNSGVPTPMTSGMGTVDYQGEHPADKEIVREDANETSKAKRQNKSFEIAASYGPDYTLVTQQLILSKFINRDNIVGLKLGYTDQEKSNDGQNQQLNISLQYKRFVSNSFYISPELVYLKIDEIDDDSSFFNFDTHDRSIGAGIRIGNQWHWDHFIIGCDWIGIGARFIHFKRNDSDKAYATLLNTYMGYSF